MSLGVSRDEEDFADCPADFELFALVEGEGELGDSLFEFVSRDF